MAFFSNLSWEGCLWWPGRNSQKVGSKSKLAKTLWRPDHNAFSTLWVGIEKHSFSHICVLYNRGVWKREIISRSRTITGTRSLHAFIPKTTDTMTTKRFSLSTTSKNVKVMKERGELEMEEVSGYVICIHNNQWWLGCVLEKDLENVQVKLSLLHPSGPSRSFWYPRTPEIVTVPLFRVVLLVEPRTTTGRTYTIPQNVSKAASAILQDTTSTWSEFLYNIFHYFAYVCCTKCLVYPEPILIPKPN